MSTDLRERLIGAYLNVSKHSGYQALPSAIRRIIGDMDAHIRTRYEAERLRYLSRVLEIRGKSVLDIGGNSGYFTFELLNAGARHVVHYEGNKEHSEFVRIASEVTGVQGQVRSVNEYFSFDGTYNECHDIVLLLNVLHHVGDDYGEGHLAVEDARRAILVQLNSLSRNCKTLILQIGFNWQGDVKKPLFRLGTKREMIEFVRAGTMGVWRIKSIAVAEENGVSIDYRELNDGNIERNDSLGEFLNRPIFILEPVDIGG